MFRIAQLDKSVCVRTAFVINGNFQPGAAVKVNLRRICCIEFQAYMISRGLIFPVQMNIASVTCVVFSAKQPAFRSGIINIGCFVTGLCITGRFVAIIPQFHNTDIFIVNKRTGNIGRRHAVIKSTVIGFDKLRQFNISIFCIRIICERCHAVCYDRWIRIGICNRSFPHRHPNIILTFYGFFRNKRSHIIRLIGGHTHIQLIGSDSLEHKPIRYRFIPAPFVLAQLARGGKSVQLFQCRISAGACVFHQFDLSIGRYTGESIHTVTESMV